MQGERGAPAGSGMEGWVKRLASRWVDRSFVRRHPLFVAALWIVMAQLAVGLVPWFACLVMGGALALGLWIRKPWLGIAWVVCMLAAEGIGSHRSFKDREWAMILSQSAPSTHVGQVLAEPRGDANFWQAPVRLTEGGAKVWWQGRGELPMEGSRVSATGRFERPEEPRNPGEFDRQKWLNRQGILVVFKQQVQTEGQVQSARSSRILAAMRKGVRASITRGLEEGSDASKVIRAVVLGEKPARDPRLLEDFRHSGSMHVFSVSGLHVGMVAVLVWLVAAASGLHRRYLVLPVIAVVFAYAWLTGGNAPAVRAAWMAAVFLGAFAFRRRPDLPNALGAVLLVLLIWDVRQLQQPSVQLSYGVVTAIAFGLPWTTRWFSCIGAAPSFMPVAEVKGMRLAWWRLRQWVAGTLAVSVAASIGAAPLTLWHFGLVTPVSVIAALLMLPLVFGVMALAMVSVLLSPLESVGSSVNRLNSCLAGGCAKVASWMAEVPGGHWQANQEKGPVLWVFDLKHGDGAAAWIPQQGVAATLIDCGGRSSIRHPLLGSLDRMGLRPDSIIITHPDGGHVGGGHPVWQEWPLRQAVMPVERARSPAYRAWQEEAPRAGVNLLSASRLKGLSLGREARVEWLHLPDPQSQNLAADHRVLVMCLHWEAWKILWLSDAGSLAEQDMLQSARDLSADVIVAGRHRSDLSLSDAFVEVVAPKAIVIGNDAHPEGERFDQQQIQAWRDAGIAVFDQSTCGAVSLRMQEGDLWIEGFVENQQLRLK